MKASFIERNQQLIDKYGHLLDEAKHYSNTPKLNELEENKMALLIDNAVKATCTEMGVDYNSFDLKQIEETAQTATSNIAYMIKTKMAMIGQVYPNMMSREIVSLQPIPQPTYKIFYNDFKRDDDSSLAADIHTNRAYANNVEYDPDSPTAVKTITMEITSEDVSATTKKLKGNVTIEVEQDLMAYHGLAAMSLITGNMGAELTREWDRTIIADLFAGATGGVAYFNKTQPAGITYSDRKFWMETLMERFIDVDTAIFKKRYRKTNYIIVPADEAGFIEKMDGFTSDAVAIDQKVLKTGGRYFSGTLKNRWRVYVDPFITGEILLGYNNPGDWTETSYVFSPYEMAYLSPEVTNPNTFVKTRAVMSRAARKLVIGDLLGKVILTAS
jgi:hypothetical protein